MTGLEIGLLTLGLIFLLVLLGMPIAIVFISVSFAGVWLLRGDVEIASRMLGLSATDSISDYLFVVVPLFVLMGLVVMEAGMGRDSFEVANKTVGRFPGGLGISTVGANTMFAAITGVSVASVAVFSKIAVPEMLRYNYSRKFATGVVAGSSVLGMLIPPSILLIIFAILSESSVRTLFLAGFVPGLILAVFFSLLIVGWAIVRPEDLGGVPTVANPEMSLDPGVEKTALVRWLLDKLGPIMLLVAVVLGGLYGGFFTATEGGAIGATMAFAIALARRKLSLPKIWHILLEAGKVTTSLLLLIVGANMYSRVLTMSGLPMAIGDWFSTISFGLYGVLAVYVAIIILLGFIMDSTSILFILVPVALPTFVALDANLIWLGIITVLAVEIGLITPPFGLSVFVVKASVDDPDVTLADIFIGSAPFAITILLVVIILAAYPPLVIFVS